jgi:hypothetical protein
VVLWVRLTVLAAVWIIALLAMAGLAREVTTGTAYAKPEAQGGGNVGCTEHDQEEYQHGG